VRGLVRRFGERVAVDGIGFEIAAGETYGLLGPNGAGKTTTISMAAGLLTRSMPIRTTRGRPQPSQRVVMARAERSVTVASPLPLTCSTTWASGVARRWLPTITWGSLKAAHASLARPERESADRRRIAADSPTVRSVSGPDGARCAACERRQSPWAT
jgi:ABC-type Mn2+/Zn2+ transport system ATPase subunit